MVLSQELLVYAENIWRRFPETFIVLGSPQLERDFDVHRVEAWLYRIVDTKQQRTIEVVLPRKEESSSHLEPYSPADDALVNGGDGENGSYELEISSPSVGQISPTTRGSLLSPASRGSISPSNSSSLGSRRGLEIAAVDIPPRPDSPVKRLPHLDRKFSNITPMRANGSQPRLGGSAGLYPAASGGLVAEAVRDHAGAFCAAFDEAANRENREEVSPGSRLQAAASQRRGASSSQQRWQGQPWAMGDNLDGLCSH